MLYRAGTDIFIELDVIFFPGSNDNDLIEIERGTGVEDGVGEVRQP